MRKVDLFLTNYSTGELIKLPLRPAFAEENPIPALCAMYGRLAMNTAEEFEYLKPGDRFRLSATVLEDGKAAASYEIAGVWCDEWKI